MKTNRKKGGIDTIINSTSSKLIKLDTMQKHISKLHTEVHPNDIYHEKEIIEMENDLPKQNIYEFNIDINDLKIDKSDDTYKKRYFDKYEPLTQDKYNKILKSLNLDLDNEYIKSFINNNCINDIYCEERKVSGGNNKKKLKGGGDTVLQIASKNADQLRKINDYCRLYGKNLKNNNKVLSLINDLDSSVNISAFITSHDFTDDNKNEFLYLYNNLPDIFNIIKDGIKITKSYEIEVNRYKVNSSLAALNISDTSYYFTQYITYYDYNADIILGFQKEEFRINEVYSEEMKQYIKDQFDYISRLSPKDTRVLKDYTRLKSFTLYQEYCKNKDNFITSFESICLKNGDNREEYFTKKMSNSFASYIIEELNLDPYKAREILNKGYEDDADKIYSTISPDTWKKILDKYYNDLNRIILNAPEVKFTFVCYRGSTDDYIKPAAGDESLQAKFTSTRTSSISFNYKASKAYYDKGNEENRVLYKILVSVGCRLLFVSPLAGTKIIYEMELIVPSKHSFISCGTNAWTVLHTSNNINNKNNICMDPNDKIKSKNIILLPPELD
jgi:hypothetical protein